MSELRRLNEVGITNFADFLLRVKETGEVAQVPTELLADTEASEPLSIQLHVEPKIFSHRKEAGEYFYNVFSANGASKYPRDRGIWAWLSLFYFEQLCEVKKDGAIKLGEEARMIPPENAGPYSFFRYYRHLLAGPYLIYRAFRDALDNARIIMCQPTHTPGDFVEQLVSRIEFVRNRGVIEAASILYFDENTGRPKSGSSPNEHRPGTLRRFVDVINQLDLTWDLFSMSGEELAKMLPPEFDHYKPPHLRHS